MNRNMEEACNSFIQLQIYKLFKNFKNIPAQVSNNNDDFPGRSCERLRSDTIAADPSCGVARKKDEGSVGSIGEEEAAV